MGYGDVHTENTQDAELPAGLTRAGHGQSDTDVARTGTLPLPDTPGYATDGAGQGVRTVAVEARVPCPDPGPTGLAGRLPESDTRVHPSGVPPGPGHVQTTESRREGEEGLVVGAHAVQGPVRSTPAEGPAEGETKAQTVTVLRLLRLDLLDLVSAEGSLTSVGRGDPSNQG